MRRFWPHRLLGCNPLPALPMGSEGRSSCQRNVASAEAGSKSSRGARIGGVSPASLPDILIPQVWVCADKFAHQSDALRIIQNHHIDPMLPEEVFGSHEVSIFSDHD